MIYICAQPDHTYFAWQVDVFINSLIKNNVSPENIHILRSIVPNGNEYFNVLQNKYPKVKFFKYQDTRSYKDYLPSIKQHLLYWHYLSNKYMENETIMLVDSDICLTKPLDVDHLLHDNIWYGSDTVSYIGYDYILSKGRDILEKMLEIADISEDVVKSNQNAAVGAQYLYKNVDAEFWREVVEMSHALYKEIPKISKKKKELDPNYHEIQIWTAEMWAMLWVAWKRGIMTCVSKTLDFTWGTHPMTEWGRHAIYHNAGVTSDENKMFYKANFRDKFPPNDLDINREMSCYNYYQLVKEALWSQ